MELGARVQSMAYIGKALRTCKEAFRTCYRCLGDGRWSMVF